METSTKHRSSQQCREWERQRRNKFNDAISRLGDIVKAIIKATETTDKSANGCKDGDNVKYPKIEIIQKAILCLTNCAQEKTQLKSEIFALQVKLESITKPKNDLKDASTQVHIELSKKCKKGKLMKLRMIQKSTQNITKEDLAIPPKSPSTPKTSKENKPEQICDKQNTALPKLPNILPKCSIINKKAQENTIVVLPAAPYIFPQRPLLFPSVPPAFVLIDSNMQALNKPIVSRNNGDTTKTTMVNILPIAAYSRPLSAIKQKKSNVRMKSDNNKKAIKKNKSDKPKVIPSIDDIAKSKPEEDKIKEANTVSLVGVNKVSEKEKMLDTTLIIQEKPTSPKQVLSQKVVVTQEEQNPKGKTSKNIEKENIGKTSEVKPTLKIVESQPVKSALPSEIVPVSVPLTTTPVIVDNNKIQDIKSNKSNTEKTVPPEDKDKNNKLPNILDTTLCESVVDVGNARLELAEEFLAASPTAAFLMSFPLVSGNRSDSPAEEQQNNVSTTKDSQKRNDLLPQQPAAPSTYFEKTTTEPKAKVNKTVTTTSVNKLNEQPVGNAVTKPLESKTTTAASSVTTDNPFLNLSMPSVIPASCTLTDTSFGLDFDCNLNKPTTNQSTPYVSNNNIFYKNDPFSTVKSTIYSTSSITSNHDFNGLGLYPCAMEKYTTKNKPEYTNIDEKIGSSRLTYDIDLGWSHKGFDFVNCSTTTTTFSKDTILTTVPSTFSTSYNPFNPEFHVPFVSSSNKKDNSTIKTNSSFADTITNFYSQANLWPEEPFYTNSNVSKTLNVKHQSYLPLESHTANVKQTNIKPYGVKDSLETNIDNNLKANNTALIGQQINEKYTKKSPSKMHINWMTSEIRPMQNNYSSSQTEIKEPHKIAYNHLEHTTKRSEHNETNSYFPISMHNFPTQTAQEEFQVWPSQRPLGTTEISIDPPPINLPTLVGDLALGPHDKKKNVDLTNRTIPQQDLQNCNNFFSVTQLMNRSSDNVSSRYQHIQPETKTVQTKQNVSHYTNDNRKAMTSRVESHLPQPYVFNDPKLNHAYENMSQFPHPKAKNSKPDKNPKAQKNNYSAEALLRGGSNCTQKVQDHKYLMSQKYNDFNTGQDSSVAQVSHFPPILDYSENSYAGQQFSGTSLYNATTNTLSNSFYSNFMPGSSNIMSANYPSGPFGGDFIDYNQTSECNYTNHKHDELKMRNNTTVFPTEKVPSNYKSSRRESAAKHKLECSKKDSNKKYQSKRAKLNNETEEWNDPSHTLWHNKAPNKRHPNLMTEDLPFPNYVGNQMASQYQPDFFNSHLMPSNMQAVPHNVDRSLASFPITSRANFNLSTIFPEITMKVQ